MDNREKVIRWLRDPKNRKTIIRIGLPMTVLALIAGGAQIPIAILAATATAGTDSLSSKALDSVVGAVVGYATELAGSKVENQRQVTEHDQRLKFEHDLLASFLRTYAHLVSAQLQSQNLPALAANLVNEIEGVCQDSERLNSFANQLPEGWIKHAVQVRDTEAIHVFLLLPFRTNLVKDNGFPIIGDALLKSAADRAEKLPVKDIQTALVKVLVADPIANQKFSLLKNFADGEYLAKLLEANNVEEFAGTRLDAEQFSQIMDSFVDKLAPLLDRLTDATDTIEAAAVKATRATTSLSDSAERLGPIVDQFQKQSQRAQSMGVSLIASNIPPGLAHYIERADLFTRIRDSLANNKGVSPQALLTGLGGSGKSVLAAGYAKAALDNNEYPGGAYFVGCENRVIVEALSELLLSTDETLKLSTTEKVHFVRSHLAAHESLLIFDNVDSQGQWLEFKTSGLYPTCDILITTRAIDVAGLDPVKVDHFFPKETKQLLAKYSESALLPENEKAIEVIHKETEGLAALVSAVGGSQRQAANPNDWNPYAKWLKAAPINQMPSANEDGYPNKTEIILDARLVKLEPAQLRILEYAAILPADRTRQSWLEWLLDADATSDQDPIDLGTDPTGASYPVKWHLEQLRRWDVLRPLDENDEIWAVHRLYRKRVTETVLIEGLRKQAVINQLNKLSSLILEKGYQARKLSHLSLWLDLCSQRVEILEVIANHREASPDAQNNLASAYRDRGVAYRNSLNLDAAIVDYTMSIGIMNAHRQSILSQGLWRPEFQNDLATGYLNRGVAYRKSQNLDAAIIDCSEAIELREELRHSLGEKDNWHPEFQNDLASAYLNRGVAYRNSQNLVAAITDYTKAIEIRNLLRQFLVKKKRWISEYQNSLAAAYLNRGVANCKSKSLDAAIADFTKAIEIRNALRPTLEAKGQWSPQFQNDLASAYMNRGIAYRNSQNLEAAIVDYTKAIEIRDRLRLVLVEQGNWHPQFQNDLARAYMNRGIAYRNSQNLEASVADYTNAIEIASEVREALTRLGFWHRGIRQDLVQMLGNRARAYEESGQPDLAAADQQTASEVEAIEGP